MASVLSSSTHTTFSPQPTLKIDVILACPKYKNNLKVVAETKSRIKAENLTKVCETKVKEVAIFYHVKDIPSSIFRIRFTIKFNTKM